MALVGFANALALSTAAAQITLESSQNPSVVLGTVEFTATVSGAQDGEEIVFTVTPGGTAATRVIFGGKATFVWTSEAAGVHSVEAVYGGNSANLTQFVLRASSTILSAAPNPRNVGQSVTFTATVGPSGPVPTGSVDFAVDGNVLATVSLDGTGVATFTTSDLVSGSRAVTASYGGNSVTFMGASSVLNHVVKSPGTHDLDGGGQSDITWRQSGGAAAAWLMNGAQVAQSGSFGTVPTSWQIVGQRDFNGDGKSDLLWRNTATGDTAMWFMNGTTVLSTASVATVGTDWVIPKCERQLAD